MRYIIFEDFSGQPAPILFPDRISFEEMREQIPYSKTLSAGRLELTAQGVRCRNEANDLGLKRGDAGQTVILAHFQAAEA